MSGNLTSISNITIQDGGVSGNAHLVNVVVSSELEHVIQRGGFYRCSIPIGTTPTNNPANPTYSRSGLPIVRLSSSVYIFVMRQEAASGTDVAYISGFRFRYSRTREVGRDIQEYQNGYVGVIVNTSGSRISVLNTIRNASVADVKTQVVAEAAKYFDAHRDRTPPTVDISIGTTLSAVGIDNPPAAVGDNYPDLRYLSAINGMRDFSPEERRGKWALNPQRPYDTISYYAETIPAANPTAPHIKLNRVALVRHGSTNAWIIRPTALSNAPIYKRGFTAFRVYYTDTTGALAIKNFCWIINTLGAVPKIIWIGYDIQGDALDSKIKEFAYAFYDSHRGAAVSPIVEFQVNPKFNIPTPVGYDSMYGPYVPGAPFDPGTELDVIVEDTERAIPENNFSALNNVGLLNHGVVVNGIAHEYEVRRFTIVGGVFRLGFQKSLDNEYEIDYNEGVFVRSRYIESFVNGEWSIYRNTIPYIELFNHKNYDYAMMVTNPGVSPTSYVPRIYAITVTYQSNTDPNKIKRRTHYMAQYRDIQFVIFAYGDNHSEEKQVEILNALVSYFIENATFAHLNYQPPRFSTNIQTEALINNLHEIDRDEDCNEFLQKPVITVQPPIWSISVGKAAKCLGLTNRCLFIRRVNPPNQAKARALCVTNIDTETHTVAVDMSDYESGTYQVWQSGYDMFGEPHTSQIIERNTESNFDTDSDDCSSQTGNKPLATDGAANIFDEHNILDSFSKGQCRKNLVIV